MKKCYIVLFGLGLMLGSCKDTNQPEEEKERTITEQHAALLGDWQQDDSLSTRWKFELDEVKWKGFTHWYRVSGDTLIISGINYLIGNHSEKELQLTNCNGKQHTLIRKD